MAWFMSRFTAQTYALVRIVAGFLFLWHGMQKLFGFPGEPHEGAPALGPIELVGGLLVMLGLFTRWAAFLCSGLMACAYWMAHGTTAFLPVLNHGELAVLYCFVFLLISAQGPGIWSLDRVRSAGA